MDRLRKEDWTVQSVALATVKQMVKTHHYARGGSNTATYIHGLFRAGDFMDADCAGATWWIPPTKDAAAFVFPENWQGVLCLSRMVILPGIPSNACSFLLAWSMRSIDRDRWPCLVTYADEWRGHTGQIYRATNWEYRGETKPQPVYVLGNGRMISRKAGNKTRTHDQMIAMGASCIGQYPKHRFVHIVKRQRKGHE